MPSFGYRPTWILHHSPPACRNARYGDSRAGVWSCQTFAGDHHITQQNRGQAGFPVRAHPLTVQLQPAQFMMRILPGSYRKTHPGKGKAVLLLSVFYAKKPGCTRRNPAAEPAAGFLPGCNNAQDPQESSWLFAFPFLRFPGG